VSYPADDSGPSWRCVDSDMIRWQTEALYLPVSTVQDKALDWFNQLAHHLNDFNEASTHEDLIAAFTNVIMASVASSIYSLGASQRSSDGFRIVTRGSACAN
jgi:hypothetical protein